MCCELSFVSDESTVYIIKFHTNTSVEIIFNMRISVLLLGFWMWVCFGMCVYVFIFMKIY